MVRNVDERWEQDRFMWLSPAVRWLTVLVFAVGALVYVATSWRWRMAVDTPVMHYVVFLMHRGLRPYAEITDNNMPGTYLTEAAAMAVFGRGDVAWRVYEFALLGAMTAAAAVLARRRDWVAGVFAGGLFTVLHSAEGPQLAVERELLIAVLLMLACAAMVEAVERRRPVLMGVFGLLCGVAAGIKPTYVPLALVLVIPPALHLRAMGIRARPYLLWALAGIMAMGGVVLLFLVGYGALHRFLFVILHVVPAYAGIQHLGFGALLGRLLPHAVLAVAALSVPLFARSVCKRDWDWRQTALLVVAVFGLLSYLAQGKGYVYHRYVFMVFLLLLVGLEVYPALRVRGWPRWVGAAAVLLALATLPGHLRSARAIPRGTSFEMTLERDLSTLGGPALSGQVQCMDLVYGCLDALYHERIVDPAGFTGDMLFFSPTMSPPVQFYRDRFWQFARRDPAAVLVVSNGVFAEENSYAKLARWPEFNRYLAAEYVEVVERHFPQEEYTYFTAHPDPAKEADSYRLYVRKADALLVARGRGLASEPVVAVR